MSARSRWRLIGALAVCVASAASLGAAEPQVFRYDAHGRRDPFEPYLTSGGDLRTPRTGGVTGTVRVEGILWDRERPLALMNGDVRRVGDEVEGYRVVEIRPAAVVVVGADAERLTIPLVVEDAGRVP